MASTFLDYRQVQNLLKLSEKVLSKQTSALEGCREMVRHKDLFPSKLSQSIGLLVSVDSETDEFPLGSLREKCDPKYLEKMDAKMIVYLKDTEATILDAFLEIHAYLKSIKPDDLV
jgi:hypothetical protein